MRYKTRKKSMLKIFYILTSCLLLNGCSSRLNQIYDYKPVSYSLDDILMQAKLVGSFSSLKKETIKGSPYNLLIVFELNKKTDRFLSSANIELFDVDAQKVVYNKDMVHDKVFKVDSDGKYRIYLSFKDIKLKYSRYMLNLSLKIKGTQPIIEKDIKLYFEKDYKEYKSNDFWDKLMSV